MIYTSYTLDSALQNLSSSDVKERKKSASLFMRAACKELGTKDTGTIKEWFVLNGGKYLSTIKVETNPEIIWTNVYTLQSFCARYIHLSHLYKFKSELITEEVSRFEEECKAYVRSLLGNKQNPKVMQAIASFFWVYNEEFVWDIFIEVLNKKKDKLTLSHIGIAIRQCATLSKEDESTKYISDIQRRELIEILKSKGIMPREIALLERM